MTSAVLLGLAVSFAAEPTWEATLERVIPSVVTIRVNVTRAFDTETARSTYATGFVVDAERGLILTNRHVVNPGPVVAEAVFGNHEEVPLHAVYRDPEHDFGLFRYDPAALRYMHPTALPLAPEAARVGLDIRVVGNDAGEKVSILAGTLARLDRAAPEYGLGNYNDSNTFYYQAASSTSGGSSGSPVLDAAGRVVALNAGGSRSAASSYYLPLDRVVRALALVQAGQPVARGTLLTALDYTPFDEARRLGLRAETEALLRAAAPDGVGVMVVREVTPGGPAAGSVEPGDVLVRLQGQVVTNFLAIESVLDEAVGQEVELELERGGVPRTVRLRVGDLHDAAPDELLEFGGGVLNDLSPMQVRGRAIPLRGVFVASTVYGQTAGNLSRGTVITAVDGLATPDLDALEAALASRPDGANVTLRAFDVSNPRLGQTLVIQVDRRWFPMRRCERDDTDGSWPCRDSAAPPAAPPVRAAVAPEPGGGRGPGRKLANSLVMVEFSVPYRSEGVYGTRFRGTGLIVDADQGLVLVDRDTVPIALGDVALTFGGAVQIPAEVVYLHPEHNFAIIAYDPARIAGTPVRSARLVVADAPRAGARIWQVGLDGDQQVVTRQTRLEAVVPLSLSLPSPPYFRDANLEVWRPRDAASSIGGALTDRRGRVLALWASFADTSGGSARGVFAGMPIEIVSEAVEAVIAGQVPQWRSFGAELGNIPLADARNRGLAEARAQALQEHVEARPSALIVTRTEPGTPAESLLEGGDLVLSVNGQLVSRAREVERAAQQGDLQLLVLRDGVERELTLPTTAAAGQEIDRALVWAGALLHATPRAARIQRDATPEGVYVAWTWFGSPASQDGLGPTSRIIEVDGVPTPDLDAFLEAVAGREHRSAVRLRTLDLDGNVAVLSLRLDLQGWPTSELLREGRAWTRSSPRAGSPQAR